MKVLKFLLKAIAAIVLMLVVFILVSGKTYLFKTLAYNFVGIDDLDLFEHRTVATGEGIEWPLSKNYNNKPMPAELKSTLEQYKTVSFLVIKNDSILYEQY